MSLFQSENLSLLGHYFVTGTDTEVGKTTVTAQLIKKLVTQGQRCYAIKPVTAGLTQTVDGEYYSDDAQKINRDANVMVSKAQLAPILLTQPCSPHISAMLDGVSLTAETIVQNIQDTLWQYPADTVLIEGAGGWFTPINQTQTLADVAIRLKLPVIVVVGVKLGCLNHAMLTLQAIWRAGLSVDLVVFNQLTVDTPYFVEQTTWLHQIILQHSITFQALPPRIWQHDFF